MHIDLKNEGTVSSRLHRDTGLAAHHDDEGGPLNVPPAGRRRARAQAAQPVFGNEYFAMPLE